jgi:hypothetical protein
MTEKREYLSGQPEQERRPDLEWIEENRILFWLVASTAFEEIGFGALVVDLVSEPLGQGHPFSYYAEGELESQDHNLRRYLQEYNPSYEFIIVLLKSGGRSEIYCGTRPPIGWMADLERRTRHSDHAIEP